jgi:hypothetical protein
VEVPSSISKTWHLPLAAIKHQLSLTGNVETLTLASLMIVGLDLSGADFVAHAVGDACYVNGARGNWRSLST